MTTNIKITIFLFLAAIVGFTGCTKTEYSLGELKTPSGLGLTASVLGVDADNPDGDGSGKVFISVTATENISYRVDFGDGKTPVILHTDTMTYKYSDPGTKDYAIIVNAIGTGGTTSSISTDVTVFVNFTLPEEMLTALTANSSKTWVVDKDIVGHFGNDAADVFTHLWWKIDPNDAVKASSYDDEVTFSVDELGAIYMKVDNKGQSFLIAGATTFYGFSGGDGPYPLVNDDNKKLAFMGAGTLDIPHTTTEIQFVVPGNGIVVFGSGGDTYEIISISDTNMELRNIGIDGNAWYQTLKPKS